MGVPVLTLAGETFMGRLTGSLMHRLGLPDFVVDTKTDYLKAACRWHDDIDRLDQIRGELRPTAQASIFNAQIHVAELEEAFRGIWRSYCENS